MEILLGDRAKDESLDGSGTGWDRSAGLWCMWPGDGIRMVQRR